MSNKQKVTTFLVTLLFVAMLSLGSEAQPPPPPGNHGDGDNQSPLQDQPNSIGGGLLVLSGLAIAYAARKAYGRREKA